MATRDLNQVVRLTRCLDVPGHTAKLVRVMTEAGYRWYPEYTVEEQFRDFNQSQYLCTVRTPILSHIDLAGNTSYHLAASHTVSPRVSPYHGPGPFAPFGSRI